MTYFGDYRLIKTIGEGAFSKVKLAKKDDKYYAIKIHMQSDLFTERHQEVLQNEVNALRAMSENPFIIRIVDYVPER